jgi:hypothetical protein
MAARARRSQMGLALRERDQEALRAFQWAVSRRAQLKTEFFQLSTV